MADLLFDFESFSNIYSRNDRQFRVIYQALELSMLVEFMHHLIGYRNLNRYLITNVLQAYFLIFAVIDFYPSHKWVMCWILARVGGKLLRYMYNTYVTIGFKFSFYPLEWFRMSAFYILYPIEYWLSVIIILATLPVVKNNESLLWRISTPVLNLNIDFTIFYFIFLCASLPNFLLTLVYLHTKRG